MLELLQQLCCYSSDCKEMSWSHSWWNLLVLMTLWSFLQRLSGQTLHFWLVTFRCWDWLLQATLPAASIHSTHTSCIVGHEGSRFWHGRNVCNKNISLFLLHWLKKKNSFNGICLRSHRACCLSHWFDAVVSVRGSTAYLCCTVIKPPDWLHLLSCQKTCARSACWDSLQFLMPLNGTGDLQKRQIKLQQYFTQSI